MALFKGNAAAMLKGKRPGDIDRSFRVGGSFNKGVSEGAVGPMSLLSRPRRKGYKKTSDEAGKLTGVAAPKIEKE